MDFALTVETESRSATISPCGRYRYWLMRRWELGPMLYFCMFNPSTADADKDDHTIRKCIGFAKHNGFAAIGVVNLFAYRATDPREVILYGLEADGPNNDYWISSIPEESTVVAAWGSAPYDHNWMYYRVERVTKLLSKMNVVCVKKSGTHPVWRPWHPLYVKYGPLVPLFTEP